MNTQSNVYTVVYSAIMVVVVAAVLTLVAQGLKPAQDANIQNEKRANILKSAGIAVDGNIEDTYNKYVTETFAVDANGTKTAIDPFKDKVSDDQKLVFKVNKDGQDLYVVPLKGNGLWGAIWGYAAMKSDFNTIEGVVFDHASETPGLGAEMTKEFFTNEFKGLTMSENGQFVGVELYKGSAKKDNPQHGFDAISGSTMTSNGVKAMVNDCLKAYEPFKATLGNAAPAEVVAPAVDSTANAEAIPDAPAADSSNNVNQ